LDAASQGSQNVECDTPVNQGVAEPEPGGGHPAASAGGLFLLGTVVGRTRRYVGDSPPVEVVQYRVFDGTSVHQVECWRPTSYHAIGAAFEERVNVRVYQDRSGSVRFSLAVASGERGEF
jgi:hypothetical protein